MKAYAILKTNRKLDLDYIRTKKDEDILLEKGEKWVKIKIEII